MTTIEAIILPMLGSILGIVTYHYWGEEHSPKAQIIRRQRKLIEEQNELLQKLHDEHY